MAITLKRNFDKNTGGGVDRDKLADSDFAIPSERKFPVVAPADVKDAVSSWGRYKGPVSFDTFKANLIKLAKRKGEAFVKQLPVSWDVAESKEWKSAAVDSPVMLIVQKQADDNHRWVMLSSNAYRDRDREIVSTKALEDDCARADADGFYGPLRFWHVGSPYGAGFDLGDCDFNAMSGRVLVESGTFRNKEIAESVAKKASEYQVSIGFVHPRDEPDSEGVFHTIRRFERSLVPIGRAANPFTRLFVDKQEATVLKEKMDALKALLGGNEQLTNQVMAQVEATHKQAEDLGIAFKGDTQGSDATDFSELQAAADAAVARLKAGMAEDEEVVADELAESPEEETAEDESGDEEEMYIGDLTVDDFATVLDMVLEKHLAPVVAMLDTAGKMAGMMDEMKAVYGNHGTMLDEMKTLLGGYMKTKDDESAAHDAKLASLQAKTDATAQAVTAMDAATKEADAAKQKKIADLEATLKEVTTKQAAALAQLAELRGETPNGVKPYIASQATNTILPDDDKRLKAAPQEDALAPFLGALFNQSANGQ